MIIIFQFLTTTKTDRCALKLIVDNAYEMADNEGGGGIKKPDIIFKEFIGVCAMRTIWEKKYDTTTSP